MKVAVVAFNNIKFSPYVFSYIDFLKSASAEVDLIYADRMKYDERIDGVRCCPVKWNPSIHKALNFLYFRSAVIKALSREKYDFVVVLTTFPAVLLSGYLASKYKGRYIVDVRDFTYERNKIFYRLESRALKNAAMRVISSPGFRQFLPAYEYTVCHNVSSAYADGEKHFEKKNERIVIGYVGTIAYAENCIKMIDMVKKDDRFEFHIHGNENGKIVRKYAESANCDRIKFFGEYAPSDKGAIIETIDLLFNAYGNGRQLLARALSNKLYDSMYYKKPLLVSPKTDMHNETSPFSFAADFSENTMDRLYEWYCGINGDEYDLFADNYIKRAFEENERFKQGLQKLILHG